MIRSADCLLPEQVERLLLGELADHDAATVESHLATCETCRLHVEDAIAPEGWWDDVRRTLNTLEDPTQDDSAADLSQPWSQLLGPTDDPASLGRLGPYEVMGLLGQGGMAVVFKGLDPSLHRYVAIKLLLPSLAASGAARKRFQREAQAVAAVVDDHVMAIHSVDQWQGVPYLVMPYVRGETLQKRLADDGPLELAEVLRIGIQAARGLAASHAQGIIHRDVKPANIFLDDNVDRVQLMDFGLARAADDASITRTGVLAGTPQYMSPEQARAETLDRRSDLFSLGAVMYAMCTGHAPFRAESSHTVLRLITDADPRPIREFNPELPEWLCAIIGKLMAKSPADRYRSADEVARLLEGCLAHVQDPQTAPLPKEAFAAGRHSAPKAPWRKWILLAAALIGFPVLFLLATRPPDLAGAWKGGDHWGRVTLHRTDAGRYEGMFTAPNPLLDKIPDSSQIFRGARPQGKLHLRWSRIERRFNGQWELGNRFGKLSLRLEGTDEIRGAFTTSKPPSDEDGPPRLGELHWRRATTHPASESGGQAHDYLQNIASDTHRARWARAMARINAEAKQNLVPRLTSDEIKTSILWTLSNDPSLQGLSSEKARPSQGLSGPGPVREKARPSQGLSGPGPVREKARPSQRLQGLSAEDVAELRAIADESLLPDHWELVVEREVEGVEEERFAAFNILLRLNRPQGPVYEHLIRKQMLWPTNAAGDRAPLPTPPSPPDGWRPLAAALKTFNRQSRKLGGVVIPPVTEQELIAAIRSWKTRRHEIDLSNQDFGRLQAIADQRALPPGARLELISRFGAADGPLFLVWSARLTLEKHDDSKFPQHVEEFRRHCIDVMPTWALNHDLGFDPLTDLPGTTKRGSFPTGPALSTDTPRSPRNVKASDVDELDKLRGDWRCVTFMRRGQVVARDAAEKISLSIVADAITLDDDGQRLKGRVRTVTESSRQLLAVESTGDEPLEVLSYAQYEFRGHQLWLVTNGQRRKPTKIESRPDSVNELLLVFERQWDSSPLSFHLAFDEPGSGEYFAATAETEAMFVQREPLLTLDAVRTATVKRDSTGRPAIYLSFEPEAAEILSKATGEHLGDRLAVFLEGQLLSAPVIRSKIGGQAMVTGNIDEQQARRVVESYLRSQVLLPQRLKTLEEKVRLLEQQLAQSRRLHQKGYISASQVEEDEHQLQLAKFEWERAQIEGGPDASLKALNLDVREAEARLNVATNKYMRIQVLVGKHLVSKSELDTAKLAVLQARLALDSARLMLARMAPDSPTPAESPQFPPLESLPNDGQGEAP